MPKIFEYQGIIIFFFSNEHEPIHVHAAYQGFGNKAEFVLIDGRISEVRIKLERGTKPLPNNKMAEFAVFLEIYGDEIVQKWIDYFVLHKGIKFERINNRLR